MKIWGCSTALDLYSLCPYGKSTWGVFLAWPAGRSLGRSGPFAACLTVGEAKKVQFPR